MGQLRGLMKPGPGRGGEVRLVLPLEDRGREIEFLLPGRFELTPQIVNRIGVLEGVREVADL
jgi:DNA polymerase-3 subunit alpha